MIPAWSRATIPILLLLALSACGGGGSDPAAEPTTLDESPAPAASTAQTACDMVAAHGSCLASSGLSPLALSMSDSSCRTSGGASVASCPAAGLVGTCTIPSPTALGRLHLYAPWTATSGPSLCMNGAWSAPSPPQEGTSLETVSCLDPWEGTCADTSGAMTPTLRLGVQRYCTGNDRTLRSGPCPRSGRSGTCTTAPGELTWRTRHYDPVNLAADQQQCTILGGLWTAG